MNPYGPVIECDFCGQEWPGRSAVVLDDETVVCQPCGDREIEDMAAAKDAREDAQERSKPWLM